MYHNKLMGVAIKNGGNNPFFLVVEQVSEGDEEIDAMEAFEVCHTTCKNGMSDADAYF